MSDLKRTLADLAERGTPIGADRMRDRVMLDLAPGSSSTPWSRVDARRPAFVILGAVAATLLLVGAVPLLFGWMGTSGSETASVTTVAEPEPIPPVVGVGDSQTVSVTVTGVSGYVGHQLAGVLYAGGDLTDLDRDALGGFWSVVDSGDFTTTEAVLEPGEPGMGLFPHVTDHTLAVSPGIYTLVVWVDLGLGGVSRWVPVNSDGMGLYGCQAVFEVGDDAQTDVVVTANLVPNGWNTDCTTGVAIPGTDAAAAVAPPMDGDDMWWPELEMSMPPVVGVGDGQTINVTVAGVSGRAGDELAGVLYAGGELTDLDGDAVGGFWTVVEGDDFTATEVVHEPGVVGVGRFPYISEQALTVEPGSYTLVLWVDEGLSPVSRWVPLNTYTDGDVLIEGTDLFGCHVVFEVGDDAQTDVAVEAGLHHNGWNTDCTTGIAIPGSDAAAAVAPPMDGDEMWWPELEMSIPPVVGEGDGQTINVAVSGVKGHDGDELAGVLYAGGELTDLDSDALGGFWVVVDGDEAAATEVVREPGTVGEGRFPFITSQALTVPPGTYTLVVWVDHGLGGMSRWVPVNSDGMGLYGCQAVFEVADDAQTDVAITANLVPDGWNTDCTTGIAIPGTDTAAAVAPDDDMWWPELEMSMPPVVGVGEGQTVSVTVSDVSGYADNELAGVLYASGELPDLDGDALGGFWVVVDGNNFTTTEVVRESGVLGEGRFPYISEQALTVAPGTYTLVLWVDFGLSPVSRWVPLNSDGMGLYGCQVVFEVGDDAQTEIAVTANFAPDGWDTSCAGS